MSVSTKPETGKMKGYFTMQIKALKIGGISLTGVNSFAYKVYSFVVLFCLNFLYTALDSAEAFKHEFEVVADLSLYIFAGYLSLAKSLAVLVNRKTIARTLKKLEQPPFTANPGRGGEQEQKLLDKCIRINTIQAVTYWSLASATILGSVTYTLILRLRSSNSEDWQFTYGPLTVLNTTYSPNFEISWCYQAISIAAFAANFASTAILIICILSHISTQFQILQNAIRRITLNSYIAMQKDINGCDNSLVMPDTDNIDVSKIPWKYLHKTLKATVNYHLAILEITGEMENVFSMLFLAIFLGLLTLLSFLLYHVAEVHNSGQLVRYFGESMSAIVEVATICYWGEQVVFQSQEVGRAAFEVQFVGSDVRFQRALALIIRRSQNPTMLTAAKFTPINLSAFTWILRTSYSAFMVLRTNSDDYPGK